MVVLPRNLIYLRKRASLTQAELGVFLEVGRTTITNWESGVNVPDIVILNKLAAKYNVTLDALLNLELSNMEGIVMEPDVKYEAVPVHGDDIIMQVPLVTESARAGYLRGMGDAVFIEKLPRIPWPVDREYKGNYIAFDVKGDSMDDGSRNSYMEGDRLLCREITQDRWQDSRLHLRKWDFVIVHKTEGIIVKQIVEHDLSRKVIKVHSLNSMYDDYEIPLDNVLKIFNIVQVTRRRI